MYMYYGTFVERKIIIVDKGLGCFISLTSKEPMPHTTHFGNCAQSMLGSMVSCSLCSVSEAFPLA